MKLDNPLVKAALALVGLGSAGAVTNEVLEQQTYENTVDGVVGSWVGSSLNTYIDTNEELSAEGAVHPRLCAQIRAGQTAAPDAPSFLINDLKTVGNNQANNMRINFNRNGSAHSVRTDFIGTYSVSATPVPYQGDDRTETYQLSAEVSYSAATPRSSEVSSFDKQNLKVTSTRTFSCNKPA